MSSWYVWSELGLYPQTPGTPTLALGSPVFQQATVHLASGRAITINAPGAQPAAPYVRGLTVNGATWNKAYLDYGDLAKGATLNFDLSTAPDTSWATGPDAAPPSDPTGQQPALTSVSPRKRADPGTGVTGNRVVRRHERDGAEPDGQLDGERGERCHGHRGER